jgi:hypothetical protein
MSVAVLQLLIPLGIIIYMIVLQFQEKVVAPKMLLILPIIITCYTYVNVASELAHPIVPVALIGAVMLLGLLSGGLFGFYRGGLAYMRIDTLSQQVLVKASALNIALWLSVLVVRIGSEVLLNFGWNRVSVLWALAIAFFTTFFLANILGEKLRFYLRATQYRAQHVTVSKSLYR